MTIASVVNILTGVFEAIVAVVFMKTCIQTKKPFAAYVASVLLLAAAINISNFFLNYEILNVVLILASLSATVVALDGSFKQGLIIAVILTLVFVLTELATLFLITFLSGITVEQATNIESYRILGTFLSKLFALIVIKLISVRQKPHTALKTSYWILFCMIFSVSIVAMYSLFILQYYSTAGKMYNHLSVWCAGGILFNALFSLYLYESTMEKADAERKEELFVEQIKAQSKHLNEILVTQTELKRLRHDLKNHNISIKAYFENRDCEGGLEYMKSITRSPVFTDDTIETGNTALDAILNTKKIMASSLGIDFETKIQIPENIFVDSADICVIFGNALDNAIEACEKIKNGDKKILISVIYDDDSLICKIVNTAEKSESKFLRTTKPDALNHGFGISNIEAALQKYKHICRFTKTDEEFVLSFVIFKN